MVYDWKATLNGRPPFLAPSDLSAHLQRFFLPHLKKKKNQFPAAPLYA